jgi:hypothetical protein
MKKFVYSIVIVVCLLSLSTVVLGNNANYIYAEVTIKKYGPLEADFLTVEEIDEISKFPEIEDREDFMRTFLFNKDFRYGGNLYNMNGVEIIGASKSDFIYLNSGVLKIIHGRTFTKEEIENKEYEVTPVLLSKDLASSNNLGLGSRFTLQNIVPHIPFGPYVNEIDEANLLCVENIINQVDYTFQVIGIFTAPLINESEKNIVQKHGRIPPTYCSNSELLKHLNSSILVPENFAKSAWFFILDNTYKYAESIYSHEDWWERAEECYERYLQKEELFYNPIFILNSECDIDNFKEKANKILDPNYEISISEIHKQS